MHSLLMLAQETADGWLAVAKQFGLPTTVAVMLLIGLWRVGKWLMENILKPMAEHQKNLANRQLQFVDDVEDQIKAQTVNHGKTADALVQMSDSYRKLVDVTELMRREFNDAHRRG